MADSNGVVSANEAIVDPVQVTTIHVTPLSSSGEVVLTPLEQIAEPEFVFPPRWRPFLRSDLPLGVCEKLKIALFSVTFMPVRLLFFFLAVVLYSLTVFIVKGCCGASADRFIRFMGRISARAALFSLGFFYISTTGSAGDSADQAPVIVCNHISWLDILVLMAQCNFPSFTAKAAVRDVPFIGYLCSANYAVYVPKNHHPQVGQVLEHPPSQRALAKLSCATYVPAAGSTKDTASADSGSTGQMAGVNARGTRAARSSSVATGAILEHCARAEQGEVPPLAIFPGMRCSARDSAEFSVCLIPSPSFFSLLQKEPRRMAINCSTSTKELSPVVVPSSRLSCDTRTETSLWRGSRSFSSRTSCRHCVSSTIG